MFDFIGDALKGFFALLTPAQWEAWRNWLATIGGVVALFIAALTYRRNVRLKREEQARLVYGKIVSTKTIAVGETIQFFGGDANIGLVGSVKMSSRIHPLTGEHHIADEPAREVVAAVWNGSKELIGPVKLEIVDKNKVNGKRIVHQPVWVIEAIDPECTYTVFLSIPNPEHPTLLPLGVTVIFRDASNSWWRRNIVDPVEAVHDDPENMSVFTPEQRATWNENVVRVGMPGQVVVEPAVALKVRWHRFWRARHGKTPIP